MQNSVCGATFRSLGGSGAIGIEALSRGAEMAVMVEHNPRAAQCIRENLKITHLEDKATVMNCDVITALKRLEERQLVFDIIFMDPPYNCSRRLYLNIWPIQPLPTQILLLSRRRQGDR